ncbi:hypothetical protein [Niabella aquatica]
MMIVLYYLTFRVYRFYIDKLNESHIPLIYTASVVSILLWINIFTLYALLAHLHLVRDMTEILPNKFYVLIPMSVLWGIIYFGIVRPRRFLNYDFEKTRKGGFAIVSYIVLTALTFVLVANLNRARLAEERLANPVKTEEVQKKPSLEGKIRKWFKDNF